MHIFNVIKEFQEEEEESKKQRKKERREKKTTASQLQSDQRVTPAEENLAQKQSAVT